MSEPDLQYMKDLRAAANKVCDAAHLFKNSKFRREAINWADFSCGLVKFVQDEEAHPWYEVVIEEASPECDEFCEWAREQLTRRGFPNIEVVTEW